MEMVDNHDVTGAQSLVLPFERRVMSPVFVGDLSVESQLNFAGIHHVAKKGNVVVTSSFLGYYYRCVNTRTRCLV